MASFLAGNAKLSLGGSICPGVPQPPYCHYLYFEGDDLFRCLCQCFYECPIEDCILGVCSKKVEVDWKVLTDSGQQDTLNFGWTTKDNGKSLRFDIEDSADCGGSNGMVQTGMATATVKVSEPCNVYVNVMGNVEQVASGYETLYVFLNGELIASAQSLGQDLHCIMGPPLVTHDVAQPYFLSPNVEHTFTVNFTTVDHTYHEGAYYELALAFT
jgi:hypothetical protein